MDGLTLHLHIGMSKTASTYLQRHFFPRIPTIEFFDQPRSERLHGGPYQGVLARSFRRSPVIWRCEGDELLGELLRATSGENAETESQELGSQRRRSILVSDQSAGPRPRVPEPYEGPAWEQERVDPVLVGSHLEEMAKTARARNIRAIKVILIFRRQDQWLASSYAQRSDRIPGASQKDFERRIAALLDERQEYFSDGVLLDYSVVRRELVKAIGRDNLLMLPFEWLGDNPEGFTSELLRFIGAEEGHAFETAPRGQGAPPNRSTEGRVNARSSTEDHWTLRGCDNALSVSGLLNRFGKRMPRLTGISRRPTIRLTDDLKAQVQEVYRTGNRELSRELGIDLATCGYH